MLLGQRKPEIALSRQWDESGVIVTVYLWSVSRTRRQRLSFAAGKTTFCHALAPATALAKRAWPLTHRAGGLLLALGQSEFFGRSTPGGAPKSTLMSLVPDCASWLPVRGFFAASNVATTRRIFGLLSENRR